MKNKKWIIVVVAVLAVIGIFAGMIVGSYNGLVTKQENVEKENSNIQVALQRRAELVPNLVNTVKGYAQHEEDIFKEITDARAKLNSAKTPNDVVNAGNEFESSFSRLLAIAEDNPEIKADKNFLALQDQLEGTENRIATVRRDYNKVVNEYNMAIKRFPTVIIAKMFGFEKYDYFEAKEGAENAPNVSFE